MDQDLDHEPAKAQLLCMQVHAEHGEAVARAQQQVFESGIMGPEGHAISRPAVLEVWHHTRHPALGQ